MTVAPQPDNGTCWYKRCNNKATIPVTVNREPRKMCKKHDPGVGHRDVSAGSEWEWWKD